MTSNQYLRGAAFALVLTGVLAVGRAEAVTWRNVDAASYAGGRKASAGYMRGKVVLVSRDPAQAQALESVWKTFKSKPFVLLGAYPAAAAGTTFPTYRGATFEGDRPEAAVVVVDETGHVVFSGDSVQKATEGVVTALTDAEVPRDLAQWRRYADCECAELPGAAVVRLRAFAKKFPKDAKAYDAQARSLMKVPDIRKLVDLVTFAKEAKDMRDFGPKKAFQKRQFAAKLKSSLSKYASLKESPDPRVAQEAKNALADITWTLADL